MKSERFSNTGLYVERTHRREGPSPTFAVCYKGKAWFELNPKKIYKKCNLSKGLPCRAAFDEWLDGLDAKQAPDIDMDRIAAEGFGPEATKMIT
jgi:hypothetical protein